MANHKSALKRYRQNQKANARNRMMRTRIKNAVKKVNAAIAENNTDAASEAFKSASSILDKAAGKKVIHWKKAARKVSRLNAAIRKIEA